MKYKVGLHETENALLNKRNDQQNEKATYGIEKNTHLIMGYYPKCMRNSYNSIANNNNKTQIFQFKKWAEELNRHFSKEDIHMANR